MLQHGGRNCVDPAAAAPCLLQLQDDIYSRDEVVIYEVKVVMCSKVIVDLALAVPVCPHAQGNTEVLPFYTKALHCFHIEPHTPDIQGLGFIPFVGSDTPLSASTGAVLDADRPTRC